MLFFLTAVLDDALVLGPRQVLLWYNLISLFCGVEKWWTALIKQVVDPIGRLDPTVIKNEVVLSVAIYGRVWQVLAMTGGVLAMVHRSLLLLC